MHRTNSGLPVPVRREDVCELPAGILPGECQHAGDLYKTPEQPLQAVKDATTYCMNLINAQASDDQVSLEIFGQTARHMLNLTRSYSTVSSSLTGMQASHYDGWTNTGGGIDKAIHRIDRHPRPYWSIRRSDWPA